MGCNPELVSAFLDGELESIIVGNVAEHLLKCHSCCQMLSKMAMISGLLRERILLSDPENMTSSVMAAIRNEKMTMGATLVPVRDSLQRRLIRYGVPAALATAALSVWFQSVDRLPSSGMSKERSVVNKTRERSAPLAPKSTLPREGIQGK